jgi:phosphoesterase RecJ-like protein
MKTEIPEILKREDRFLIVTHINPDGDAVGSLLGMYLALSEMGKQTWALLNDKFPDRYSFLPSHTAVLTDSAQLTADPKWIISLDVAAEPRISADLTPFRDKARLINVDHHPTNDGFGDVNLIEPDATSTAEIVYRILKHTGYELSRDVGKCLYTGVITDTGCFRFSGVNSSTLHLAAEILESGFDSYEITRHVYEEYPLRRLELERLVLDRMQILLDGRLVISTLFADDFSRLGAPISESENLVNRLRESHGVEVGVLLTQLSEETCRASLRSKGRIDVAAIAQSLGGGGHKNAAGLRSTLPVDELRARIAGAVEAALS